MTFQDPHPTDYNLHVSGPSSNFRSFLHVTGPFSLCLHFSTDSSIHYSCWVGIGLYTGDSCHISCCGGPVSGYILST